MSDSPPHPPASPSKQALAPYAASGLLLIKGSDLKPVPVQWIWPGWLAAGKFHILGGSPGTGKTTISMSLAATITKGGRWPDDTEAPPGNVVIWSGEDDPRDTLIPRLIASGANVDRVHFIGDVISGKNKRTFDPSKDIDLLHTALSEIENVKLLIVDPIVSAVIGDSHKNAEVRKSLQPLADLAVSTKCALLGITHFSKGTSGRDPVERITGSLAFGALARIVLVAAKVEGEVSNTDNASRVLLRAKNNLGPDGGGFSYDFNETELSSYPGLFTCRVLWGESIKGTARDILTDAENVDENHNDSLTEAKDFLKTLLTDGPVSPKSIKSECEDAGISWATIRRAKKALKIKTHKIGMDGGWEWVIPRRCSIEPEGTQQKKMSTFEEFEHLRDQNESHSIKSGSKEFDQEAFEERVAIMEFDGKFPRIGAEDLAKK